MADEALATESIAELIERLCPDGVEWVEIESLFTLRNGYTPSKKHASYWENGSIPWFRMEDIRENGHELSDSIQMVHESAVKGSVFPANSILMATSATIGEHALVTVPHLSNQRFTSMQLKPAYAEKLDMRFAHYYAFILDEWCKENTTMSSFASVDMKRFRKFQFPLPPLVVQRKITSALDQSIALDNSLKREIEGREKQFSQLQSNRLTVDASEELGALVAFSTTRVKVESIDAEHYTGVENLLQNFEGRVSGTKLPEVGSITGVQPKDVLLGNIRPYLKKAWFADHVGGSSNDVLALRVKEDALSKLDPAWLFYVITSEEFLHYNIANSKGAKMPRGDKKAILKYQLPLPPLEFQQQTARELDTFRRYIANLKRERELRQKQYEGLREQLLTFSKKESA